jgi:polyferredoxin
MGWVFQLASGSTVAGGPSVLLGIVASPWFLFTMSVEMGLTTLLLWREIDPALRVVLIAQAAIMFLSPPAFASPVWHAAAIYLASAAMVALFVFLMEWVYRHKQIGGALAAYMLRTLGVYTLMMAGLYLWLADGSAVLFVVSVVLEMIVFLHAVANVARFRGEDRMAWQLQPGWAFQLLFFVFVTELFMGALLDLQANGRSFLALAPQLPLSGTPWTVLGNATADGFWFVAVVTGSVGFLLMMGAEMGALVLLKIREARQPELRLRMGLMMAAFAGTTLYFPGFWSTVPIHPLPNLDQVPVLGWTMGIGSGGGVAPGFFAAILATYILIGSMSFLFGRRAVCSVLCSAPLMYQGTLIDSMKSFNRSSPVGRKYLGSQFSTAYTVTAGLTMTSLVGASLVSYFDAIGRLQWTIGGADPAQFLFSFYFGVLWYVMFVTIPYTGNYNCVTMGWCHWGTFSQAFSRLGFFRLKAKDRAVCRACTTLDCAKSCPVGLVDMVGQLRTTGVFRSSKCCGVGDCVGACPYGNLYIHDVRHWLRGRRPTPTPSFDREAQLPMVRVSARPTAVASPRPADPRRMPVAVTGERLG